MASDGPNDLSVADEPPAGIPPSVREEGTEGAVESAGHSAAPALPKRPAVPPLAGRDIERIVHSSHDSPHTVLGPHFAADGSGAVVRAFLPFARRVWVALSGGGEHEMQRIADEGLFEAAIAGASPGLDYRFKVIGSDDREVLIRDAYAFDDGWFTADDEALFTGGRHVRLFEKLGAHLATRAGTRGVTFAVWAPAAMRVSVVGTFNAWDGRIHSMRRLAASGVWELFIPDVGEGALYKYEIKTATGDVFLKGDPFAFRTELHPQTASIVHDIDWGYSWLDAKWIRGERAEQAKSRRFCLRRIDLDQALADGEAGRRTYRDLLAEVLATLPGGQVTHVELSSDLPGYGGSASFFAPGPGFGTTEDLMELIDACHQRGIGVILPTFGSKLPASLSELAWFDGTCLYEEAPTNPAPSAPSPAAFDRAKGEVRSVLASNAAFWADRYHADGWRTDASTADLYRAMCRSDGPRFAGCRIVIGPGPDPMPPAPAEVTQLTNGRHHNPHGILGPHQTAVGQGLTVRARFADAEQVSMVLDTEPETVYELARIHPDGLFATTVAGATVESRYRYLVCETGGHSYGVLDAYAFTSFAFSDLDQYLFGAGNHYRIYEKLGAHLRTDAGVAGVGFTVWAPNADGVSVVGSFNGWDGRRHPMMRHGASGVWEIFVPEIGEGELYKFEIRTKSGHVFLKSDPYALLAEVPPGTASIVTRLEGVHRWRDQAWMERRRSFNPWEQPIAIYEVHLGSWMRGPDNAPLTYTEVAAKLIPYVKRLGFTHIELLPIAEHPYEPSWGYQVSNFYAPTSRFGRPQDLMAFVDACHSNGIGVILDWVPGHFPKDAHALAWFDGTHLYEHADPRKGEHRDWGTLIFNYGRHEVENFLIANALFWLETYHFDGLRVDAVASMLYLDYSKPGSGEWIPNIYGGRENLEAIEFLKHTNVIVHERFPGVMMIAEESTAWPNVSRPADMGGLGFGFKWNMGWMHDVLAYMGRPPEERKHHHGKLTFSIIYAFNENFILALSHDEVVHMKGSLLAKKTGEPWEKFANLRLLLAFLYAHPGKKLLFMGGEFGQAGEWNHATGLDWRQAEEEPNRCVAALLADLNRLYRRERALFEVDFRGAGFEWLDVHSADHNVIAFVRKARDPRNALIFVLNFAGVSWPDYRVGVPYPVAYRPLLDTNDVAYGGAGGRGDDEIWAEEIGWHGQAFSLRLRLPALSAVVLKPAPPDTAALPHRND